MTRIRPGAQERTQVSLQLHCEQTMAGQLWAYTGEEPERVRMYICIIIL